MTNSEAIKILEHIRYQMGLPNCQGNKWCPNADTIALDLAIQALERDFGDWIPVSERLPESRREVIVCNTKWMRSTIGWYYAETGAWYWSHGGCEINQVTHWMPLPKPLEQDN